MKINKYHWFFSLPVSIFILFLIATSCDFRINQKKKLSDSKDLTSLEKIKARGKIIALTDYNSTSYFIYRGTPMGFQ